jgi:hypothetical protein
MHTISKPGPSRKGGRPQERRNVFKSQVFIPFIANHGHIQGSVSIV